jgi:hypothetical protein
MKATWIYYPYSATGLIVQGAKASSVAAKRMDPLDSIRMVNPPAPPSVGGAYTNYTNNYILTGGSYSLNSFRVRAVFLPQLFTKNFEVRGGATVTLNTGTYEVYGSWILRDSRIIINGDVKFVINPNLALTGLDWQNSSVEINPNSTFEIYNGYSMDVRNCWLVRESSTSAIALPSTATRTRRIGSRSSPPMTAIQWRQLHRSTWSRGAFACIRCGSSSPASSSGISATLPLLVRCSYQRTRSACLDARRCTGV